MDCQLTLCLHRGITPVSHLIQWFTRSEYSHVSVVLPDGRQVEAREGKGVVMHPQFRPTVGEAVEFYALEDPLNELELSHFMEFVHESLGSPYDYRMAGAFLWRGKPSARSESAYFCSEWAYEGLLSAGRQLLRTRDAWRVSPRDFGLSPLLVPASHPLAA